MNFGLLITIIGCALFVLAIAIHWIFKLFSLDESFTPFLLGIGLILVPIGLVIGVMVQ